MKIKTLYRIFCWFRINRIYKGTRFFNKKVKLLRKVGVVLGDNTKVVGPLFCTGKLVIGDNCWIGKNLNVYGNGIVTIEDNCDIAPNVSFHTGGHRIGNEDRRAGEGLIYNQIIGAGTWVCGNSTFIKDSGTGKGCVVAACACVKDKFEDNVLVGGVPAKIIKKL